MLCGFELFSWDWVYELVYYLGIAICKVLNILYQLFRIFAGTQKVTYGGSKDYLINIFFNYSSIRTVYAGMALIGIAMLIGFTMLAVGKKMFDLGDKMQQPIGEILRKAFTSFLFILLMNFIMLATIEVTNTLMQSIEYLFVHASEIENPNTIKFEDDQYATMARVFDTIGNYSVNPSAKSRYNINSCFNDIRGDLQVLESQKVFNYSYEYTESGEKKDTWQSVVTQIARAHDLNSDQPLDQYNVSLSSAIIKAMDYITVNSGNMSVLKDYTRSSSLNSNAEANIDVMIWLTASSTAARNTSYNGNYASLSDPVRVVYMNGEKSIYNYNQVAEDFNLSFSTFDHLIVIIGAYMLCKQFLEMCINCVARIFNMLLLYVMAPPFIATAPYDDGAKFKQWSIAFIIQSFNVFGSIVAIRLLLMLIPIIFSAQLILFENGFVNLFAKVLLVMAAAYTAQRAGQMISGIVAENASTQSMYAGDTSSAMKQSTLGQLASGAEKLALSSAPSALLRGGGSLAKSAVTGGGRLLGKGIATAHNFRQGGKQQDKLRNELKQGGDVAKRAANDFLSMDKGAAMKKYAISESGYNHMRSDISWKMQQMNQNGSGGTGGDQNAAKKPPNINSNTGGSGQGAGLDATNLNQGADRGNSSSN